MPDEANVHYSSYLTQLFEGHQWLKEHLDYIPKFVKVLNKCQRPVQLIFHSAMCPCVCRNGWSIDPFGQSPSLTYLLGQSGVKNKVINRIHYIMKRYFRKHKNLEFFWRQQWGSCEHFGFALATRYSLMKCCSQTMANLPTCSPIYCHIQATTKAQHAVQQDRLCAILLKRNSQTSPTRRKPWAVFLVLLSCSFCVYVVSVLSGHSSFWNSTV